MLLVSILHLLQLSIIYTVYFRQARKSREKIILVNICTNLALVYIIFLGGISQTSNATACTVAAAFLHYVILTSWMWMTVYSYDLHFGLVTVSINYNIFLSCNIMMCIFSRFSTTIQVTL